MIVLAILQERETRRIEVMVPAGIEPPYESSVAVLKRTLQVRAGLPGEQDVRRVVLLLTEEEFSHYDQGCVDGVFSEENVAAGEALKRHWMVSPNQLETAFFPLLGGVSGALIQVMRQFERHEEFWSDFDRWLATFFATGIQFGQREQALWESFNH